MTELMEAATQLPVAKYRESDAAIATLAEEVQGRTADTPAGYKLVMSGLSKCRNMRVAIEKQRKTLKSDALKWGRTVDGEAKRLTGLITDIEEPLVASRKVEDDRKAAIAAAEAAEEERLRMEAEEEARKEREAIEEAERAERQRLHEEQLGKEREEQKRKAEEFEKLRAERLKQEAIEDAEREKERAAESKRMAAENLRLAEEAKVVEIKRQEAQAIIDAAAAEKEAVKLAAEEVGKRIAEKKAKENDAAEVAKFCLDCQAIDLYVGELLAIVKPAMGSERGERIMESIYNALEDAKQNIKEKP